MSIDELSQAALSELPIFPLPGTVLMPRTFISLHVFEPRYRALMEDCIESHRAMAIAMLDGDKPPDIHGRPRIHPIAGVGMLRRSARLPDGRYNIVLEGIGRVDVSDELGPSKVYRRARAKIIPDVLSDDPAAMASAVTSLRALCGRALTHMNPADSEVVDGLNAIADPSRLADMVAAAAIQDALERQRALSEPNVLLRLEIVSGALGTILLAPPPSGEPAVHPGWGITTGKA